MQIAYSLDKESLIKILKGAGIALGGSLCVYLLQTIPQVNFGTWTPVIVAVASIIINAVKEYIAGK